MDPGEEAGGQVRCDRQTERHEIEAAAIPSSIGELRHDAHDSTLPVLASRSFPLMQCHHGAVKLCVTCRAPTRGSLRSCWISGRERLRRKYCHVPPSNGTPLTRPCSCSACTRSEIET